jgi:hypothetical protein
MEEHDLKCWPQPYQALEDLIKTFEWRFNDRDFEVRSGASSTPPDKGEEDSCWGFYGDTLEETGLKDLVPDKAKPLVEAAWRVAHAK